MKKISFAIACIALLSTMTASAVAQNQLAKAQVPFAFSVHEKTFPAGTYELRYLGGSFVRLQDVNSTEGVTLFAPSAIRESTGMKWTFRQYGEQRFLAAIADPVQGYQAAVPKSNLEREIQKWRKTPTMVALRASK